jgi:hypothetical protein
VEQSNSFIESEMALVFEGMLKCAQKLLDTADIVRDGMFQQVSAHSIATHWFFHA